MAEDLKSPIAVSEIDAITESLNMVITKITAYEKPIILGGNKPSDILEGIKKLMADKRADATNRGPKAPTPVEQR